jgi:putative addiction module component (TIGR02574 family)
VTDEDSNEFAWEQEIARRIEELDSGKAKTIPWEAVQRRIAAKRNKKQ